MLFLSCGWTVHKSTGRGSVLRAVICVRWLAENHQAGGVWLLSVELRANRINHLRLAWFVHSGVAKRGRKIKNMIKTTSTITKRVILAAMGLAAVTGAASAQNTGWRKVTDPPPAPVAQTQSGPDETVPAGAPQAAVIEGDQTAQGNAYPQGPVYPTSFPQGGAQGAPQQQQYPYPQQNQMAAAPVPAQLTLKPGTFITVRLNNPLSSDRNQQGDAFSATLAKPIIVDGVVVARTGETLAGRVSDAQKAGRISGTSKLGLQLTDLTLADGTQVAIQSDLMTRNGRTTVGNDVATVGATTGIGAAIGAAADGGRGAGIGAGAGAAASLIGVLLTRGQPTIVGPETLLTFRITAPVTISTERAPQAFRYATEADFQHTLQTSRPVVPVRPAYGPYPYYGPGYYYGPTVGLYVGPRYHYRRW